jgi:hypothetical protein
MFGSEGCQQSAVTNIMFIPWRCIASDGDNTILGNEPCVLKLAGLRADASDIAAYRSSFRHPSAGIVGG